jgi:predicted phage tail protein
VAGVLCEGGGAGITAIDEVYVDDKLVTFDGALSDGTIRGVSSSDTNFYKGGESLISIQGFFGLDNQSASSLLDETTNWTSDHKLSGLAYVALRFKWNQDAFNGLPEVRVTVRGKKIYDPRLDSTKGGSGSHRQDTASTWAYSANSSLVLLDYLRNTRYGKGLPNDAFETNYDSFKTSANTCDTQVTPYSGATSDINLFETNAVIDSEKKVLENVRELLVPMRAIFNYTQGKYKVIIEGTGSSQLLLTKDNVVSEVKLQGESKSEKYNRVIGTFTNPEKDYQSDTVSYPPFDDSALDPADQHATMLSDDNNTLLERSFDMLQVTSPYQAEEICENILKRSRNNLKAEVTVTSEALNLSIGDIVTATYDTAGFSAKPFRVMSLAINSDSTVTLGLEEHQDNFYTWEEKGEAPTIADTVLPNPFSVSAPASVTLDDQLIEYSDGVVITALDCTIGASPDNFVDYYQVEYKLSTDSTYQVSGQVKGLNHRILNVIDGLTYNVRVKAFNTLGVQSSYTSASRTIVGGIAPPSDVEDFACNIIGGDAHLSWTQILT